MFLRITSPWLRWHSMAEVQQWDMSKNPQSCSVHTLRVARRTHILLTHYPCVAYRHRVHAWPKVFCSARVTCRHLTFSLLKFHPPSLLFPRGHLDTLLPSAPSLPNCSRSEGAGQAQFRTGGEEFGYLADPTHSTGYEPEEFDKTASADGDTTPINDPNYDNMCDFSKNHTREHWTVVRCFHYARSLCFARFSWWKQRQHALWNHCWTVREKKEKVLWSVLQSRCQRKVNGTVLGVLLFRLTENSILIIEISERTWNEELNRLLLVKIQLRRKNFFDWVRPGDSEVRAKKFTKCVDWVATRAWISKTTTIGSQWIGRSSSAWENTIV